MKGVMEADTRNGAWLECQYSPPTNEKINMGHLPPNTLHLFTCTPLCQKRAPDLITDSCEPPRVQEPDADQEHGSVPCICPSSAPGRKSVSHLPLLPIYFQQPHLLNHDTHHAFSHRTKHLIAKTDQPFSPHTPLKLMHTGLQPSHNLTIFLHSGMHPPDLLRDSLYSPNIYFKAAWNC